MDVFRGDQRFEPLVVLFNRVANILAKATETLPDRLDPARLAEPLEQELAAALEQARARTEPLWRTRDYEAILPALLEMEQVIHGFFEAVLVNAEEQHFYLSGVIRPIDIDQENNVKSSVVAEAEVEFTGRGVITDNQRQGVLSQFFSWIWPF
jgi:hypothetical protein